MNKQHKNRQYTVCFASVGAVNAAALAPSPRKQPKREHPLRRRKPKRQGSRNQTGKRLPMMTSEKRFVNRLRWAEHHGKEANQWPMSLSPRI